MSLFPCESCEVHQPSVYNAKNENQFKKATTASSFGSCRWSVALIFLVFTALMIIVTVYILHSKFGFTVNQSKNKNQTKMKLELPNLNDGLRPKLEFEGYLRSFKSLEMPKVLWQSDTAFIYSDLSGDLIGFSTSRDGTLGLPEVFLISKQLGGADPLFNSDVSLVALKRETSIFPYSAFTVKVGSVKNNNIGVLYDVGVTNHHDELQFFQWNPIRGSSDFVFVFKHNLFYQRDIHDKDQLVQVTKDGSLSFSYALPDPAQLKYIYGGVVPVWWSKTGRYIAYASFDNRNVTYTSYSTYEQGEQSNFYSIPYPKPGTEGLPQVILWIWDKLENTKQYAMPSEHLFNDDQQSLQYLIWAQWAEMENFGEFVLVFWANRHQNFISAMICMLNEPCFRFFKFNYLVDGRRLWSDPQKHLQVKFMTKSGFFIVLPRLHSTGDVYDSVAFIDISHVNVGRPRYKVKFHGGAYDVNEIVGYDNELDDLFFTAQGGLTGEMHLFRVSTASGANGVVPQCITCLIQDCKIAISLFSPNSRKMLIHCETPFKPGVMYLKSTSDILEQQIVNFSPELEFKVLDYMPMTKYEVIKLDSGVLANVQLILPPNFDPELSYPVLLDLASNPGGNVVWKRTPEAALNFLASNYHVVILRVDAHGSGLRGWRIKGSIYDNLGGPEVNDQLETLSKLLKRLPFLDASRVSLVGRDYGAFVALLMVLRDKGSLIRCVALHSPMIDVRLYSAFYIERFLRSAALNDEGYGTSSLLNSTKLDVFKNIKLLIAHGALDLEVLFENSARLFSEFQKKNIHFTQLVYPNEAHHFLKSYNHFINERENFLTSECFV